MRFDWAPIACDAEKIIEIGRAVTAIRGLPEGRVAPAMRVPPDKKAAWENRWDKAPHGCCILIDGWAQTRSTMTTQSGTGEPYLTVWAPAPDKAPDHHKFLAQCTDPALQQVLISLARIWNLPGFEIALEPAEWTSDGEPVAVWTDWGKRIVVRFDWEPIAYSIEKIAAVGRAVTAILDEEGYEGFSVTPAVRVSSEKKTIWEEEYLAPFGSYVLVDTSAQTRSTTKTQNGADEPYLTVWVPDPDREPAHHKILAQLTDPAIQQALIALARRWSLPGFEIALESAPWHDDGKRIRVRYDWEPVAGNMGKMSKIARAVAAILGLPEDSVTSGGQISPEKKPLWAKRNFLRFGSHILIGTSAHSSMGSPYLIVWAPDPDKERDHHEILAQSTDPAIQHALIALAQKWELPGFEIALEPVTWDDDGKPIGLSEAWFISEVQRLSAMRSQRGWRAKWSKTLKNIFVSLARDSSRPLPADWDKIVVVHCDWQYLRADSDDCEDEAEYREEKTEVIRALAAILGLSEDSVVAGGRVPPLSSRNRAIWEKTLAHFGSYLLLDTSAQTHSGARAVR